MIQRKDVVTFADIMENLDQIPKGDPFARGRGPADPLRERAMADALAAPQLAERVRELEAEQKAIAVQLQRLAPTWSHETKSWTMRQADDGPYTLWSAAAETIRATMWERDEMRRLVRELEAECERLKTFAAQNFSTMIRQEAEQMREYGLSYEGVRQVLHEYNDGEISFGKLMDLIRAAARAMAEDKP
jgi:hypothetical protein